GSLLITKPEDWIGRAAADRKNSALAFRGSTYNFDELKELRREHGFDRECAIQMRRTRHAECQEQIRVLSEITNAVSPDVVVVIGDDQHEWFSEDVQPSLAIFCGDKVEN